MSWKQQFAKLRGLVGRKQHDEELDEEIRAHLELEEQENRAAGMSPEEAHYAAVRKFGNVVRAEETAREMWHWLWLETLVQDIRFGLRMLAKNPGFTLVAVITLALGIGANTAIFSLINTVMLRYLPVEKPVELVQVGMLTHRPGEHGPQPVFTNPLWEQIRDQQDIFSGVFGWGDARFDLALSGAAQYVKGLWVSGDFFQTLGVRPAVGRLITTADDQRGCAGVAVLSYGFWQNHFGGAESAIGSTISLDNHVLPIVGVAAPGFYGVNVGTKFDVALPVCATAIFDGKQSRLDQRSSWWMFVMGRVKPGLSPEQMKARLAVLSPRVFAATIPENWTADMQKGYLQRSLVTAPGASGISGLREQFKQPLQILMAVVGVVFLIACANIASVMLARAATRSREVAVRRALGASRMRLVRQLLTECVLLSSAGAVLGIFLARWGNALLVRLISSGRNPVFLEFSLDWRVLGFALAVAMLTGILFGILPAFRSTRVSLTAAMKGSQAVELEHHGHFRPGRWLVAAQVALSLVLVVGAALFLRSFVKLVTLDVGFERNNVLIMHVQARAHDLPPEKWAPLYDEIERRLATLPGVVSASRSVLTPVSGFQWDQNLHADSPNSPSGDASATLLNAVSPGYFRTLLTPILAGRDFNAQDTKTAPKVAIINQTAARKFYPGLNPVGRHFRLEQDPGKLGAPVQVVGVVKDSKYWTLREETRATAFIPITQQPDWPWGPNFLIRVTERPSAILSLVQASVVSVDNSLSLEFHTLAEQVDDSLVQERLLATLSAFFGGLALLLAMIGLYGAVSYMVAQRQTEFGIRMALGASPVSILRLVLDDVAIILAVGVAAGFCISLASVRVLEKLLYGLAARDAATLIGAALLLSFVALVAGYIPARRATKVDPLVALRYE